MPTSMDHGYPTETDGFIEQSLREKLEAEMNVCMVIRPALRFGASSEQFL